MTCPPPPQHQPVTWTAIKRRNLLETITLLMTLGISAEWFPSVFGESFLRLPQEQSLPKQLCTYQLKTNMNNTWNAWLFASLIEEDSLKLSIVLSLRRILLVFFSFPFLTKFWTRDLHNWLTFSALTTVTGSPRKQRICSTTWISEILQFDGYKI